MFPIKPGKSTDLPRYDSHCFLISDLKVVVFALFAVRCYFSPNHGPAATFARHNVRRTTKRLLCGVDMFAEDSRDLYFHETNFRAGSTLHEIQRLLGSHENGGGGERAVAGVED